MLRENSGAPATALPLCGMWQYAQRAPPPYDLVAKSCELPVMSAEAVEATTVSAIATRSFFIMEKPSFRCAVPLARTPDLAATRMPHRALRKGLNLRRFDLRR